ncbi:hypothetical protein NC653_006432 [Populus alba x Populus x berolinensis]|uniref:Uncharacterized protein n=1 Tax=Populus alba x Populus x berolinensis TaxID=444605 RepID=A0AAD6RFC7_9ROSI|nr:hypothetical protein NC653_006432 [Populus alba x Populus x berolinensis]
MKAVVSTGSPIQMNQKFQISISNSVLSRRLIHAHHRVQTERKYPNLTLVQTEGKDARCLNCEHQNGWRLSPPYFRNSSSPAWPIRSLEENLEL